MKRIFVSATTRDPGSYRRLASESLRKRGYEVDGQEIFNLTFLEICEKLKQRIAECDAVVCLIGVLYGGEPTKRPSGQPRRSYTQWEFYFALELGKPVYVLRADEKTPFDLHQPENKTRRALQRRYREQVVRDRDWSSFDGKDKLRAELAELRFPWEPRRPEHRPCNLRLGSIGPLFKGRESFLDKLKNELARSNGRAAVLHGLWGVGKTRAAIEYAWRNADDYTALLFVSAPTPDVLRDNLTNMARGLGTTAEGTSIEQQLEQVLLWLEIHHAW
jgi:hypothetical protein